MMRLRALLILLAALTALPQYASEIPLGDVSYAGTCEAWHSRAVSNGHSFYGAWTFTYIGFLYLGGTIGGAATDANGAPLTPTEHNIGGGPGAETVASNGADYLVAVDYAGGLGVRRVDARGVPTGELVALSTGVGGSSNPSVDSWVAASWNGSHFLVTGTIPAGSGSSLHGALLAATINDTGHAVQTRTIAENAGVLDAAPAGQGRTLLLLQAYDAIQSLLINDDLTTTAPVTIATAPKSAALVASNGSGFLVVWSAGGGIRAKALDGNGLPHDAAFTIHPGPVNPGPYDAVDTNPAVTWDGSSYLVAWELGGVIYGARTNGGGATPPFAITPGYYPSLASNDDGNTIALSSGGCGTIFSTVIQRGAPGTDGLTRTISREAVPQGYSRALRTARGTQVVWYDQMMHLSFVDGSGAVSQQPLTSTSSFTRFDLIATPRGSAAAWPDNSRGVRIQQFDASGHLLSPPVIAGTALAFDAALAALGDDVAVAYTQDRPDYPSGYDFFVSVLGADGSLRRTPVVSTPLSQSFSSTLAAVGVHYLAVWRESQSSGAALFSAVIDRNAHVLAKQLIVDNARITIGTAIGTNGEDALLAWNGADASQAALYAQRLDTNGAPIGAPLPVATSHRNIAKIQVVPEGANYVITYVTVSDDGLSTLLRQITCYPDSSLSGKTLLTLPGGNVIDSYTLEGANVTSLVLRRSTIDLETNGAARLYWSSVPAQHVRVMRNR